jgi:coproporphyrinogen III oxidase
MNKAEDVWSALRRAQAELVGIFERYDAEGLFGRRQWDREGLGGGLSCVLEGGRVFERAGVNVSLVSGEQTPPALTKVRPQAAGKSFKATGISMVLHPRNPYAPSFHANFRYLEVEDGGWWFGGGMDLTPMYGFDADAAHFHRTLRDWCGRHEPADYPTWKATCDDYFYLPHRDEMRGVGGVFFDHLSGHPFARLLAMVEDGAASIPAAYLPILDRRVTMPYTSRERTWQLARRGRYVEFNLVYDRGTVFGLQTGGNTEAILISMPPLARWAFDVRPEPGSPEADVARFLKPHDWAPVEEEVR